MNLSFVTETQKLFAGFYKTYKTSAGKKPTLITFLVVALTGVLLTTISPTDPDFGWHFVYGRIISATHQIPTTDFLSFTMPNYAWTDSYWLAQVFFYNIYNSFGFKAAPFIVSTLLSLITALVIVKTLETHAKALAAGVLVFLTYAFMLVAVRPMLFSSIFLLILGHILVTKKHVWLTPLCFIIWTNSHADFIPGLFVLGIYTLELLLDYKKNIKLSQLVPPILAALTTFITPQGIHLITTLLKEANPLQFKTIMEWLPIAAPHTLENQLGLAAILAATSGVAMMACLYYFSQEKPRYLQIVVILIFFALALRSVYFFRHVLLLATFPSILFATSLLNGLGSVKFIRTRVKPIQNIMRFYTILFFGLFVTNFANDINTIFDKTLKTEKAIYPTEAISFIKSTKPQGNMFNNYGWGGYLIWKLPEYKTFVDGRMPSWRTASTFVYNDYVTITKKPEASRILLDSYVKKYNITFILDKPKSNLIKYAKSQNWKILYQDETAAIAQIQQQNP